MDEFSSFFDNGSDVTALIIWGILFLVLIYKCKDVFVSVPQGKAYIVEQWGRYKETLGPGLHFLTPIAERIAFKQDLREQTINVPPQECFTSDNVKILVDGVMYITVTDPQAASYGVTDYSFAAIQLAQTATRSVIGTIELDKTFEERETISSRVVSDVNDAGQGWGIRIHRYEIKNISTPNTVRAAMEQQVTAEREGRALVARAEGDKQSRINRSEGQKLELINKSQGEMQARINEAEGQADEILKIANATAESIEKLADAITGPGGEDSRRMQLLEKYFKTLAAVGRSNTQIVLPANLTDFNGLIEQLGISQKMLSDEEIQAAQAYRAKRQSDALRAAELEMEAAKAPEAAPSKLAPAQASEAGSPMLDKYDAQSAAKQSPTLPGLAAASAPMMQISKAAESLPAAPPVRRPPPPMRPRAPIDLDKV